MAPSRISDLFGEVGKGSDAERRIVEHFEARARRIATQLISRRIQARVSASDVVNEAMRSALSELEHGRVHVTNRSEFAALLLAIVRRKVASEARQATAAKRTVAKEVPLKDADRTPSRGMTPEQRVVLDELVERARVLLEEIAERDGDERKRFVLESGILCGWTTRKIKNFLEENLPASSHLQTRTIERWLAAARARLSEQLDDYRDPNSNV